MAIARLFSSKKSNSFNSSSTAEEVVEGLDLRGKTILITGCNSGLGKEAVRVLSLKGARILALARTLEKAQEIGDMFSGEIIPFACELSDPSSVRACVQSVKDSGYTIDAMICFAGIMALPQLEKVNGYEKQFYTNHMGHFILVTGLLDQLAEDGRVILLSSDAHRLFAPRVGIAFDNLSGDKGYKPFRAYGQSKLANVLFVKELARRFEGTNRVANAVHPGATNTGLHRNMNFLAPTITEPIVSAFLKSIEQGTATAVYAAVHPTTASINGAYFANCTTAKYSSFADDVEMAKKLWDVSEKIAGEDSTA